jgi:phosphohistidine swiveling domain-containing protein
MEIIKKTILEKMFSREKSLMYLMMWNISDKVGYKDFLGYDLKNSLFIYDSKINKTSVWYDPKETEHIAKILSIKVDDKFIKKATGRMDNNWEIIFPYLSGKKKIKSIGEFKKYYKRITMWWSSLNTVYPIINNAGFYKEKSEIFLRYRKNSEHYILAMDSIMCEFWQTILGNKYKDLVRYLSLEEAIAICNKKINKNKLKIITERKNGFIIYKRKIYPTDSLARIITKNNLFLNENKGDCEEFKGTPVFSGIAKGNVVKIVNRDDINNLKKGGILVAETTFPDHALAMQKAAAIITDEGGITCHAAIVSRELKKPCIVGTKIATQVLKDGDLVEVNADKGVIKILKRNKNG